MIAEISQSALQQKNNATNKRSSSSQIDKLIAQKPGSNGAGVITYDLRDLG